MPSGGDPQLVYRFHVYATASSVLKLRKPGGGILPTMVLSETHAEARHYGFVGLSEGAYGGP